MIHSFIIHLTHSFFVRISKIFKEHKLSLDVCGLTHLIPIEIITLTDSLYEVTAQDVCGTMYNNFSEGNKLISAVCDTHLCPGPLISSNELLFI